MFSNIRIFTKVIARLNKNFTPLLKSYADIKTFNSKDILSSNEISVYKKLFDQMDSNGDGYLTKDDLKKGLNDYVKYSASDEELNETMEALDSDRDGSVGFDEFIGYIAWSKQMRTEEAIRYAFNTFDKNNDGLINKEELREALVSLDLIPNESLLNNVMQLSGKDGNENITLDEFRKVFYSKDI